VLWLLGTSGLLLGAITGLKQTAACYAFGAVIALIIFSPPSSTRLRGLLVFAVGGIAGALATGGFWSLELYRLYGNPILPFLNNIFKSPYVSPWSWSVGRLGPPPTLWQYLVWPLLFTLDSQLVNQLKFFDIRFGLLYVLVIVAMVWFAVRFVRHRGARPLLPAAVLFDGPAGNLLLVFFAGSFVAWMLVFPQYRYLIPLELLVPLCFLLILDRLLTNKRLLIAIASVCALATLATFRPFDWVRLPWSDPYISVKTDGLPLRQNGLVVMLGNSPISYVIPSFPGNYRFVHPESSLIRLDDTYRFSAEIQQVLHSYHGTIYLLYDAADPAIEVHESAQLLGLYDMRKCSQLDTGTGDNLQLCIVSLQNTAR
jgi:hypothetical protein